MQSGYLARWELNLAHDSVLSDRARSLFAAEIRLRELGLEGDDPRIPEPRNSQELWAQHKYSVMARDPELAHDIGGRVAAGAAREALRQELEQITLTAPAEARLRNAVEHMWGHVAEFATQEERDLAAAGMRQRLEATQRIAVRIREPYLLASTALSELAAAASLE